MSKASYRAEVSSSANIPNNSSIRQTLPADASRTRRQRIPASKQTVRINDASKVTLEERG